MGFFKDLKGELTNSINESLKAEPSHEDTGLDMVNTLDEEPIENEKLDEGITTEATYQMDNENENNIGENTGETEDEFNINNLNKGEEELMGEDMNDNVDLDLLESLNTEEEYETIGKEPVMEQELEEEQVEEPIEEPVMEEEPRKEQPQLRSGSINEDEITIIAKGTNINGNIASEGSLEIMGNVTGDVECLGKLTISGKLIGDASAPEVYVNSSRVEGNIISEGSIKVGISTVIIGDITATSGVIAGAIKGEIDINGPVIIDSSAIIKGNIKAKSIQVNNGAIIEGFCSLSYATVDVENIFG